MAKKTYLLKDMTNMGKPQKCIVITVIPPASQQLRFPAPENYPVGVDRVAR